MGLKFPPFHSFLFFTDFATLTNANVLFLCSLARVTGILLLFLSQVSQLLAYNAVNDSVIDVLLFSLTV